jgi:hypothetical protein
MATLNVENKVVSFGDVAITNNPRLKYVDWLRTVQGVEISEPVTKSSDVSVDGFFDIAGDDQTGAGTSYTINSIDTEDDTRTKIYGNFGTTVGDPLTKLDSISVLSNGLVSFAFNSSEDMTLVAVGDMFNVRGASTGDDGSPINSLNEGLWKIVKISGNTALCRKLDGCSGAINQSDIDTLTDPYWIVVFRDPYAVKGNYAYVKEEGSDKVKPLYPIIYADSTRIDIGFVPFVIDTTSADGKLTIVQNKFCFAYIETSGDCTVLVQTAVRDFNIPVSTISLPNGEKIGWLQLTSDFNFIQVQNTGDQPIKVSAIVGG